MNIDWTGVRFGREPNSEMSHRQKTTEVDWMKKGSTAFTRICCSITKILSPAYGKTKNVFADNLNDIETSYFITGLMEAHEKMAWMLRAHLR